MPPVLSINIIGCGKLGKTISKLLKQNNATNILGVVNSTVESAQEAVKYIGDGKAYSSIKELPKADIYFIATRDDLIEETAKKLQAENLLKEGAIVLHCSGSLTSDVLKVVKDSKCFIASIHPIKSFANPDQAVSTFPGTYCAIEGDVDASSIIVSLFEKIGGVIFPIKKENKRIYHAGGVIANNYLVTLHYHATQCYINAGVDEKVAKKIVSMLMNDALNNVMNLPHDKALTGPIQRGDKNTIISHVASLEKLSLNATRDVYLSMGLGTLPLTSHPLLIKQKLEESLSKNVISHLNEKNLKAKL